MIGSYFSSSYVDKSIQTDAWEDYSERASQIVSEGISSVDTVTPRFSPIEYINTGAQVRLDTIEIGTQTLAGSSSTATTVLPIPPIDIPIVPNPDITTKIIDTIVWGSDYIDRAEALADMLGLGFM